MAVQETSRLCRGGMQPFEKQSRGFLSVELIMALGGSLHFVKALASFFGRRCEKDGAMMA